MDKKKKKEKKKKSREKKKKINCTWLIGSTTKRGNGRGLKILISCGAGLNPTSSFVCYFLGGSVSQYVGTFRHDEGKHRDRGYSPHVTGRKSILTPLGSLWSLTG